MKNELYEPKVLKRIGELRATETPFTIIKEKLKKEFNFDATTQTISKAYDNYVNKTSEIIAGDDNIKKQLMEPILNTSEQLKKINEITWHILDDFDTENQDKIKAIKEVRNQLELQEKLLNNINQSLDPQKISKIEYTKISVNNLKELEEQGLITINRKMDEPIDAEFIHTNKGNENE